MATESPASVSPGKEAHSPCFCESQLTSETEPSQCAMDAIVGISCLFKVLRDEEFLHKVQIEDRSDASWLLGLEHSIDIGQVERKDGADREEGRPGAVVVVLEERCLQCIRYPEVRGILIDSLLLELALRGFLSISGTGSGVPRSNRSCAQYPR